MAGTVLTVASGKGGVGKTATAVNVGLALQAAEENTVVVDADLGTADLRDVLDLPAGGSIHEVLAGETALESAVVQGPADLSMLAGDDSLTAFAMADPGELERVLRTLAASFDRVVVDTGPAMARETVVPMRAADGVLLVTTPRAEAVADTRTTAALVERVGGTVVGAVLTRAAVDFDVATVADRIGTEVLAVVPEFPADQQGVPVLEADESYAAQAYRTLASKLADRLPTPERAA
ncbi:MAG: AAA family ATPase [Halorientalis sp.]